MTAASGSSRAGPDGSPEAAPTSLVTTVVRGFGLAGAGLAISRLLTFVTYLVLAHLAAPSVFGEFAAGSVLVGIGGVFVESGMAAALIQRRDRVEEAASTAFVAVASAGLGLGLLALASSPLVGLVFDSRRIGWIAAALAGVLVVGAFKTIPDALMQRRFSFLRRVVVDPIGVLAFATTAIVALRQGMGVWALVLGTYASEAAQTAVGWKLSRWRPALRLASFGMWRELAAYGRFILAGNVIGHVGLAANAVLLGRFVSASALGQYRYATRFATLPHDVVVNAASYVLFPALARISDDTERFTAAFRRSLRWMLTLAVPVSLLLVPLGEPLIVVLLGERWRPAGQALMVLAVWGGARAAGSVAAAALEAIGRPQILPALHLLNAVLTVALMIAFLPLGVTGVAAGASIAAVVVEAATVVAAARVAGVRARELVGDLWPALAAAGVMVAVLLPLDRLVLRADRHGTGAGVGLLALEAAVGAAVTLGSLGVFAPRMISESAAALRAFWARFRGRELAQPADGAPIVERTN